MLAISKRILTERWVIGENIPVDYLAVLNSI